MDQRVTFASGESPCWPRIAELLRDLNFSVEMRMIDGELAFPDEEPPDEWNELRIGAPGGMITLRRHTDSVDVVTWGNADRELLQAWNALTWAVATAAGGTIATEQDTCTAEEFREKAQLPPQF